MSGFTTRPELRGTFGMIATTHWVATAVGMSVLEKGGNAFDAAVTAGLTLQVVEPHQNGPGGDMPAVFYSARDDKVRVLCAQAPAPAGATIDHYKAEGLDLVPGTGLLAACIPGAIAGWLAMLRDHGTIGLREAFAPAIHYARTGYPVAPVLNAYIKNVAPLFEEAWPTSAALYLKGGKAPETGSLFANPVLADMYERLVSEGEQAKGGREAKIEAAHDAFYKGFVAETVERFCAENEVLDSSGERHKGVLTAADMAGWTPGYEEALTYDYRGHTLCKTGPWGQGPVALQTLALMKGWDWQDLDPTDPVFLHTYVEAVKLAMADREAFYGDPDFADVPMETLLSDAYNDARRAQIGHDASMELRPGTIEGYETRLPESFGTDIAVAAGVGEPNAQMKDLASKGEVTADTVHVSVADGEGNLVSCMPSGGWLQSSPVIPELGFCLGTRAQMYWLEEGLPASLEPGKRPRSTLSPGIVLREGKPYMAYGSPGGDGQDQWAVLMLLRHIHAGQNLQEAIDTPSLLSFHQPNSFYPRAPYPGLLQVEDRMPAATVAELEKRGHKIEIMDGWSLGRLCAVARENGLLKAAANPRFMQGYAAGR